MVTFAARPRLFPLWLRRFHSWWFAGQVVANILASWFIIRLVDEMDWAELAIGLLVGQGFLLSVWLALGGLPNLPRLFSVSLVTMLGSLAVADQAANAGDFETWVEPAIQVFIVCFFMVLLFHGLLLPLRWLLGWRLDFDPAYHPKEQTPRLQLSVVQLIGWTTFVAIPCGILRGMPGENVAETAIVCLLVSAMALPVAATLALAVTARRTLRWSLLAAVIFLAAWSLETLLPNLVFSEHFLQFNLGIAAAVAGNLLVLRLFGLKLFSVIEERKGARESENAVRPPHFPLVPAKSAMEAAGS